MDSLGGRERERGEPCSAAAHTAVVGRRAREGGHRGSHCESHRSGYFAPIRRAFSISHRERASERASEGESKKRRKESYCCNCGRRWAVFSCPRLIRGEREGERKRNGRRETERGRRREEFSAQFAASLMRCRRLSRPAGNFGQSRSGTKVPCLFQQRQVTNCTPDR